jgi:hypothetical protein
MFLPEGVWPPLSKRMGLDRKTPERED